jgi:hypothetical protein
MPTQSRAVLQIVATGVKRVRGWPVQQQPQQGYGQQAAQAAPNMQQQSDWAPAVIAAGQTATTEELWMSFFEHPEGEIIS